MEVASIYQPSFLVGDFSVYKVMMKKFLDPQDSDFVAETVLDIETGEKTDLPERDTLLGGAGRRPYIESRPSSDSLFRKSTQASRRHTRNLVAPVTAPTPKIPIMLTEQQSTRALSHSTALV